MPALFALAQHSALEAAAQQLRPGERILAFLDDLYVVASPDRAREAFQVVTQEVLDKAGVQTHLGKLRVWSAAASPCPASFHDLNAAGQDPVWVSDAPEAQRGLVVLGVPLGSAEFVQAHALERTSEEKTLLDALAGFDDLQVAWTLLRYSAVPRANHIVRVLPPSQSQAYAKRHDDMIWATFCNLVAADKLADDTLARQVASLPGRLGGLGLRSAERTAPGAFAAAWLDAMPTLRLRAPDIVVKVVQGLADNGQPTASCLQELRAVTSGIVQATKVRLPAWHAAAADEEDSQPPQPPDESDPSEFRRGWQHHICSSLETLFKEQSVLPASDEARRALLRSQSGPGAVWWLAAVPTSAEYALRPLRLQTALRRRLRWPLAFGPRRCNGRACGAELDPRGDHWTSCTLSGRIKRRSRPQERIWARICREAGARVQENVLLRDTGLPGIGARDGRRLEVVATGLPVFRGVPLGIDASLVSPLHADGQAWLGAAGRDGVAIARAERAKRVVYRDLVNSPVLRLTTVAAEVGGRMSVASWELLRSLAVARARSAPQLVRTSARAAWLRRWATILGVAIQDAVAATLVDDGVATLDGHDGATPLDVELWVAGGQAGDMAQNEEHI